MLVIDDSGIFELGDREGQCSSITAFLPMPMPDCPSRGGNSGRVYRSFMEAGGRGGLSGGCPLEGIVR